MAYSSICKRTKKKGWKQKSNFWKYNWGRRTRSKSDMDRCSMIISHHISSSMIRVLLITPERRKTVSMIMILCMKYPRYKRKSWRKWARTRKLMAHWFHKVFLNKAFWRLLSSPTSKLSTYLSNQTSSNTIRLTMITSNQEKWQNHASFRCQQRESAVYGMQFQLSHPLNCRSCLIWTQSWRYLKSIFNSCKNLFRIRFCKSRYFLKKWF